MSYPLVEAHLWLWSYCRCELPGWVMLCLGLSAAALIGLYGAHRTNPTAGWRFRKTHPRAGWWLASAIGFLGVMTFSAEFRPGGVLLALALAAAIGLLGHRRTLRGAVSRRHRTRLQARVWLASTLGFFGMMRFVSPLQPAWHLLGLAVSAAGLYAMLGGDRHCRTVLSWGRRLRRPRYSFPFWCFVCFLAGNAALSLLMAGPVRMWPVVVTLTVGMLGGQAAVHSIWCVFSPLPWAQRFLAGAISASALLAGLVVPPALFERRWRLDVVDDLASPLLCLPLFLLAAQAPMWIMRFWFRWRIVARDDGTSRHFEPLRIGGLLVATAVVSLAMGALRLFESLRAPAGNSNLIGRVFAALVIMVISGITVLPAALACLRARRLLLALALAFVATATVPAGFLTLMMMIEGRRAPWQAFVVVLGLAGVYFVYLTVPLLIARRRGCRLLCRRD